MISPRLMIQLVCLFICFENCFSIHKHKPIQCLNDERDALLKLKQAIHVDNCGLLTSWSHHNLDCCNWHGVHCSNRTGHVVKLLLPSNYPFRCLEGELSPSLKELQHLTSLDLSFNDLHGQPIPHFIASLVHLKHLNLSSSGFSGEIPPVLANLSSLTSLDLSSTAYILLRSQNLNWVSHLTLLRHLDLSLVDLTNATDWFKLVTNLTFLRVLHLDYCNLSPPFSFSNINFSTSNLRILGLGSNNLNHSSTFKWLLDMSSASNHKLVHIDLSWNSIPGPIPSYFGIMTSLQYLDLSRNQLEGPIPRSFGNITSLSHLDLSYNNLTDELSCIIQTLSAGCACKSLSYLDLSSNQLWGSIPNLVTSFSVLETLSLSNNSLTGTLSNSHLSNLLRLKDLFLSFNPELVVNISSSFLPPFQLSSVGLSYCKIGPYFPNWLLTQTNLTIIGLSNVGILDAIPSAFWNSLSSKLRYLNMSTNKIYGRLPHLSVSFSEYPRIDLSYNNFTGTLPAFLRNASQLFLNNNMLSALSPFFCPKTKMVLSQLDLSHNLFSRELPDCWTQFNQLSVLNLANNKFSGNLPSSLSAMKQLQVLHLRNNRLSGQFSGSLVNFTSLVVLDIAYNLLRGHIPPDIGNGSNSLAIVILRSNNLSGKLPESLCNLASLQILDLSSNFIFGAIPNCIYNLTTMTKTANLGLGMWVHLAPFYFDRYDDTVWIMWKSKEWSFTKALGDVKLIHLSNNRLGGKIPEGISSLIGLVSLDLSRNNLSGSITPKIGQLTSLEFLDLSSNHLYGQIPASLSNLNFLAMLNLSFNNLSGTIPSGTQLQGFNASTYMGNPKLCGPPLPQCSGDHALINTSNEDTDTDDFFLGLCVSIVLGFIIGFWGVCGSLVLKRSWRHAYFQLLDDVKDKIYVKIALRITRGWRLHRS